MSQELPVLVSSQLSGSLGHGVVVSHESVEGQGACEGGEVEEAGKLWLGVHVTRGEVEGV